MAEPPDHPQSRSGPTTTRPTPSTVDPSPDTTATGPYDLSTMAPATVQPSAPTSADADTALPAAESGPKSLGDYELLEKIGEGGMGIIYRARHRRIRHVVALKVMRRQIAGDPDQVKRFEREVRAQARMQHRHIVKIYDIKLDGDQPYYTMALVVGGSLDKRRQEFAEPTKAAELVRKIALAIEH